MTMCTLTTSAILILFVGQLAAAQYFLPKSKELFKVEKIPLQVDSMKEISQHLTILAQREQENSPADKRGSAQLLALALRLDPANQDARETNQLMRESEAIPSPPQARIETAKSRLRFYQHWLTDPEAGEDANTLSLYLIDATRTLHEETKDAADQANWAGVLPPLSKYVVAKAKEVETIEPAPPKIPESPKPAINPYKINQLSLRMPLIMDTVSKYKDPATNQDRWKRSSGQDISPITLSLKPKPGPISFAVRTPLSPGNGPNEAKGLHHALEKLKSRLNATAENGGVMAEVRLKPSLQYSSKNGSAAAAGVQLMLEASKAGKNLRKDLHLCAALNLQDQLALPENFWDVLKKLREENAHSGRLIVPTSARLPLTQLLVFSEPDFFTRWEVIGVDSMSETIQFSTHSTNTDFKKAEELFLSIRKLTDKNAVTKLTVNSAVRSRLNEILSLNPNHLSAEILLLQGSGKRPMRLSKIGTAYQIQSTVAFMRKAAQEINIDYPSAEKIKKIHDQARAEFDAIEKLINTDNKLYQEGLDIANDARSLSLLVKRNQKYNNSTNISKARAMALSIQDRVSKLETRLEKTISSFQKK